jgi:hypothetical protein
MLVYAALIHAANATVSKPEFRPEFQIKPFAFFFNHFQYKGFIFLKLI